MKKFFAIFAAFAVLITNLDISEVYAVSAQSAVLIDAASGRVLYSYNAEEKRGMASTTKIMTAITAIENGDLNSIATVSPNAYGVEGSSMYLVRGEKLSLENLLYGLMLVSGNDAATAVAEHISGSVDAFAALMNKKAAEIGAYNSNFTNPHGLSDKNHYTTAHDLAKITAYALKNPAFAEIVATKTKSIPWQDHDYNRRLVNHNKFLSMYDGCIGVKTGFTKATGRCLVTAVERDGMRLVCVTLNAPDDWNDHREIYDKAFGEFKPYCVRAAGTRETEAEIKRGAQKTVGLVCAEDICIPLREGEEGTAETVCEIYEDLRAPIEQGDVLGQLRVRVGGEECGSFPLCAAEDIPLAHISFAPVRENFGSMLRRVIDMWVRSFV